MKEFLDRVRRSVESFHRNPKLQLWRIKESVGELQAPAMSKLQAATAKAEESTRSIEHMEQFPRALGRLLCSSGIQQPADGQRNIDWALIELCHERFPQKEMLHSVSPSLPFCLHILPLFSPLQTFRLRRWLIKTPDIDTFGCGYPWCDQRRTAT